MPYTAQKPKLVPDSNDLRSRIAGWGVDLDPKNRPAVPKERFNPGGTGAHWDFPERQIPHYKREKSLEHKFLTPVFGTVCPPKGISGLIRRYAYTLSEGRASHWTLLMFADRVNVIEVMLRDLIRGRPDNFIKEYGLQAEIKRHGLRSRIGRHRADVKRAPLDLLFFVGTGVATVLAINAIGRSSVRIVGKIAEGRLKKAG